MSLNSIDVKTKSTAGVQGRILKIHRKFQFLCSKKLNVVDLDLNSIAFKIGT